MFDSKLCLDLKCKIGLGSLNGFQDPQIEGGSDYSFSWSGMPVLEDIKLGQSKSMNC